MKASSKWFSNTECRYYPCHDATEMNCLFCFCPLYFTENCGGKYVNLPDSGQKDCSACLLPHTPAGYEHIMHQLEQAVRAPS